jgi:hypothetical protein
MAKDKVDDLLVVIRSAGERTKGLCELLVREQVSVERIIVIAERPFSKAICRAYEIGIDFGLPWTLCLDADMLLLDNSIFSIRQLAEQQPKDVFGITGNVADKFYGGRKSGGPHLYRTCLLEKALPLVPDAEAALRPETYVKEAMKAQGHSWATTPTVFALHDYEQFYSDIFRKMVVRANKSNPMVNTLLKRAKLMAQRDNDFLVAMWGLRYGLVHVPEVIDSERWRAQTETLMICHGLKEKDSLELNTSAVELCKAIREKNRIIASQERARVFSRLNNLIWHTGNSLVQLGSRLQRRVLNRMVL